MLPAGAACALHADVSNRFQVANMIEQARDAFGAIDILVNAVAIRHAEPLLNVDEWNWRRQIEVNITGTILSARNWSLASWRMKAAAASSI